MVSLQPLMNCKMASRKQTQVEFPFTSADQLLELSEQQGLGGLILRNEVSFKTWM
ncbi:hypothetical protein O9993_02805 [Vibrio lentus]|nr:hypothetical protein [Vibrio lentus]